MYTFESKIRYSELAEDGMLSLGALINYFQDCSTFQSEHLGVGVEELKKRKRAWFLSSWQIDIDRYPGLLEPVTIGTAAWDFKGFYGSRNFALMDPSGKPFVRANSLWVFVNTETGRLIKPEAEDTEPYGKEEPLSMEYLGRRISLSGTGKEGPSFLVGRHQIDTNGHMNNSQYVQMAAEFLPKGLRPFRIRVEYKRAATYGQEIFPVLYEEGMEHIVALCDQEKKPWAVVAFYTK